MKVKSVVHGGTTTSVYWFDKGERLVRHRHPVPHTLTVITGACVVEVFDDRRLIYMTPDTDTIELPPDIDHEILTAQDGTVLMAVIVGIYGNDPNMARAPGAGGVLMADGTTQ